MSLAVTPWIALVSKNPNSAVAIDPVVVAPSSASAAVYPLDLSAGGTLIFKTHTHAADQTITIDLSHDFLAPAAATAAEVMALINRHSLYNAIATNPAGVPTLSTISAELSASIEITGGTANAALAFPVATNTRGADVAFPTKDTAVWGKAGFSIAETTSAVTAVTATIDVYGWVATQSLWHKIQTVVINEAGICDFFLVAPFSYPFLYLSHSAGAGNYEASYQVSS